MFKTLMDRLFAPTAPVLDENDARLAITALLVRLARSDNTYGDDEIAAISQIIAQRFELSETDTTTLLHAAEAFEAGAPDTIRFTNAVKHAIDLDHRMSVVSAAWAVVLADGVRSAEEDALMRMIPRFLGISDRENNETRLKVARELGLS